MNEHPASPRCVAVFGGVYSNHLALEAVLADARARGAAEIFCLGDMGGFGPHPDRSIAILRREGIPCVQGNYDHSIGHALDDCACGYTDPRDNHFAAVSYAYTLANTSADARAWLRSLPPHIDAEWGGRRVRMAHGSPRRTNEFLWESTTPSRFVERMLDDVGAEVLLVTHTGLHWCRELSGGRMVINVGAIGRPANDGDPRVWYTLLHIQPPDAHSWRVEFVPVCYDTALLARQMREQGLPDEFVETIETGWWTTCLEILPPRERARGRY